MDAIRRVLVANRGEIARRVFATCRRLGVATVAVYSDPDANAPFAREADSAVPLGGATAAESYLRVDAVIDAALRAGADAIHPGYGFLSENASFAQAVIDAGLIWIGPPPAAIAAMGSKTRAREQMEGAGVPVLPAAQLGGKHETNEIEALAQAVGYPLLVKASAGGGGKGMRLVHRPQELTNAFKSAKREAGAAFGDDTMFLERFAARARHVEIQIIADKHGRVCSLHERDCSIQRRHQKVIEEAPSPAVDPELRARMSEAAVAAGEAIGYDGAGTVEFLLTAEREFYFLEVNTRLQVEHPVTELVTGLDLVELQLLVAEGRPLPDQVGAARIRGHAIETRLYAEDPANGFLPATGVLERFELPAGVRVDAGVEDGARISPYYDPMLAKVCAHGASRDEAARKLADALRRAKIHGLTTNRDFLVRVLEHPEFLQGQADTAFLDRHDPAELAKPLVSQADRGQAAAAAALAAQSARRGHAKVLRSLPTGWRNNVSSPQSITFTGPHQDEPVNVEYRFGRTEQLETLRVDGEEMEHPVLYTATPERVDLVLGGVRRTYHIHRGAGDSVWVNTDLGQIELVHLPRFPQADPAAAQGSLQSPLPGRVIRVFVQTGSVVEPGDPLLIVEAMKMEHEIVAPSAGAVVELRVDEGHQVETGSVLAVIE